MGRKCNLELRLSLAPSVDDDGGDHKPQRLSGPSTNQHQCIAILHGGQISVCDVTELHAKAIIWWASKHRTSGKKVDRYAKVYHDRSLQIPLQSFVGGLSIKRSLQIFLEKRSKRIRSTSPYDHDRR